jgi:hypothetical protein
MADAKRPTEWALSHSFMLLEKDGIKPFLMLSVMQASNSYRRFES